MRTVFKTSEVQELVRRANYEGTVEVERMYEGLRRLERHEVLEETLFDKADDTHGEGKSGWPPVGYWGENTKVTTE